MAGIRGLSRLLAVLLGVAFLAMIYLVAVVRVDLQKVYTSVSQREKVVDTTGAVTRSKPVDIAKTNEVPAAHARPTIQGPLPPKLTPVLPPDPKPLPPRATPARPADPEDAFHSNVQRVDMTCSDVGTPSGDQWALCAEGMYAPHAGSCLVYSFLDTQRWNFEQSLAVTYKCRVRLYNPIFRLGPGLSRDITFSSTGLGHVNGQLRQRSRVVHVRTLGDMRDGAGEAEKVIDYLKLDIDTPSLLKCFKTILYNGDLESVKQLAFPVVLNANTKIDTLQAYIGVFQGLEKLGFKKWYQVKHPTEKEFQSKTGKTRYSYQVVYVNSNFLNSTTGNRRLGPYAVLPVMSWTGITAQQAELQFERFVHQLHYQCKSPLRVGRSNDGGWQVCADDGYKLKNPCLVYSFGINNDWTFDDAVSSGQFGCDVRAFDPSMHVGDHRRGQRIDFYSQGLAGSKGSRYVRGATWKMNTLAGLMEDLGDSQKTIDFLKVDIEYSEWESFDQALKDKAFAKVKQLAFEIHTDEMNKKTTTVQMYKYYYDILQQLEALGFRKWSVHNNQWGLYDSARTGEKQSCCYEMSFININLASH